jgi:hypothetical protein
LPLRWTHTVWRLTGGFMGKQQSCSLRFTSTAINGFVYCAIVLDQFPYCFFFSQFSRKFLITMKTFDVQIAYAQGQLTEAQHAHFIACIADADAR